MSITVRKSDERGKADYGWLKTRYSFSFANYYDPRFMGFGFLRVINDDCIAAGKGFGTHPHDNMEIVTYVLDGELEHKDSMGNGSIIKSGDVQRMSAGTGVTHSEFNPSDKNPVKLFQIWFTPKKLDIEPSYEQKNFSNSLSEGFTLIVSPDGENGSVSINQDVYAYVGCLNKKKMTYKTKATNKVWVQVADGSVKLNDIKLEKGDGAAIVDEFKLEFSEADNAKLIMFDMHV